MQKKQLSALSCILVWVNESCWDAAGANDEEEEKADTSNKQEAAEGEDGASLPMEQDDNVDAARGTDKSSDTPAIFSLMFVNSYGTTDYSEVKDNGEPIKFDSKWLRLFFFTLLLYFGI